MKHTPTNEITPAEARLIYERSLESGLTKEELAGLGWAYYFQHPWDDLSREAKLAVFRIGIAVRRALAEADAASNEAEERGSGESDAPEVEHAHSEPVRQPETKLLTPVEAPQEEVPGEAAEAMPNE